MHSQFNTAFKNICTGNQYGHEQRRQWTAIRAPKKIYAKPSFRVADIKMKFETGEARTQTPTSVISVDFLFLLWRFDPIPGYGMPFQGFAITLRHTTLGRTPPSEWSAFRREFYLNTQHSQDEDIQTPEVNRIRNLSKRGGRPTPSTVRPLRSAVLGLRWVNPPSLLIGKKRILHSAWYQNPTGSHMC